jgi:hypothetical protein
MGRTENVLDDGFWVGQTSVDKLSWTAAARYYLVACTLYGVEVMKFFFMGRTMWKS